MYSKSTICATANRLRRQGYSYSQSFVIAWAMAKGQTTAVSGTSFRQKALEHLTRYTADQVTFTLVREPENIHDHNAVAVMASVNGSAAYKIGYIPSTTAPVVSAILNNGTRVRVSLRAIVGGWADGINYGLRLCVNI